MEEYTIVARALYQRDIAGLQRSFDFIEDPILPSWHNLAEGKKAAYISQAREFLDFLLAREWEVKLTDWEGKK